MEVPPLLLVAARALHFWAVATLLGGAGFILLLRDVTAYARGALRAAAALAALAGLIWFTTIFVEMAGAWAALIDPAIWQAFLAAPFGLPWALRLALCAIAGGMAISGGPWPCLVLGLAFVVDQAWLGHAAMASGSDAAIQIPILWLHVLAGFVWTGALVMICVLSLEARRVPPHGLALFSAIGIAVVLVLTLSGIANASIRGVRPTNLLSTPYGQVLCVKLGLVVCMVVLALVNRHRARRVDEDAVEEDTKATLWATLWLEMVAGLAVLLAAATLGTTPPPGD